MKSVNCWSEAERLKTHTDTTGSPGVPVTSEHDVLFATASQETLSTKKQRDPFPFLALPGSPEDWMVTCTDLFYLVCAYSQADVWRHHHRFTWNNGLTGSSAFRLHNVIAKIAHEAKKSCHSLPWSSASGFLCSLLLCAQCGFRSAASDGFAPWLYSAFRIEVLISWDLGLLVVSFRFMIILVHFLRCFIF